MMAERERSGAGEWDGVVSALSRRAHREGLVDVSFQLHEGPFGCLFLGATEAGVVRVGLPVEDPELVMDELAARVSPRVLRGERPALTQARRQLDQYFQGERREFELPLDWRLTRGFRREVLRATARIPYGSTASYREVATSAGSPAAVRAAGTALATNPIPILVPCHRVLRTGGQIGSYRGGAEMKERLLSLEKEGR